MAMGGCGATAPANNLANFTGATWSGSLSASATCNNMTMIPLAVFPAQITFQSAAPNEIEYTSGDGCLFKFGVSGDTATLSNGPVKCSKVVLGAAIALTYRQYTATTTDGHNLTAEVTYDTLAGSITCTFTGNGAATR